MHKLGKLPYRHDPRTLKLTDVFRLELPPPPDEFDVDDKLQITDNFVYANDKWGDCAVAAPAHQVLRFEKLETQSQVSISDSDVLMWYWRLQGWQPSICDFKGRPDNGLVELDVLKAWRSAGFQTLSGNYKIDAFGLIDWKNHDLVKKCIWLLNGAYTGCLLPLSAQKQIVWDMGSDPGSWGGHAMYLKGYTKEFVRFVTWGYEKLATWAFLDKYCDELWGIVDAKDSPDSPIDVDKLNKYLDSLKEG